MGDRDLACSGLHLYIVRRQSDICFGALKSSGNYFICEHIELHYIIIDSGLWNNSHQSPSVTS